MRELHLQLRCTKPLSAKGIESGRSSSNVFICTCVAPQLSTPVPFAFHPPSETLTVGVLARSHILANAPKKQMLPDFEQSARDVRN